MPNKSWINSRFRSGSNSVLRKGVNAATASLLQDWFFGSAPVGASGQVKVWGGAAFTAKPVKVWNGSAFITKPCKWWSGAAWVTTNY